jgi:hypothetical protein
MTAFSRSTGPAFGPVRLRALIANPFVRAAGAAALLGVTAAALVLTLGPSLRDAGVVKAPLAAALAHAPAGWREALHPLSGGPAISHDVVRLSERPVDAALGEAPWRHSPPPPPPAAGPLPPAPIAGLFAPGPGGPLPVIGKDGRTAFDAYRRPFQSNGRPRIALVIGGLGLDARLTQAAIDTLPAEITFAFSPYADGLQAWIDKARARGHEVLLETPMEPVNYPDNDPGPYALMAQSPGPDTVKKLEWILSRASGYFGLTNSLGSRFLASDSAYSAFATAARGRGLGFIDDGQAANRHGLGLPRASAERAVDSQPTEIGVEQQLLALESGALQRGQALGEGSPYPVTLATVATWAHGLDGRGFQLAPASALARK